MQDTTSAGWYNPVQAGAILTESMAPSFETGGDELGKGVLYGTRGKYIHTVGVLGPVSWVSKGTHAFTGIFEGADKGFARLSFAREPNNKKANTVSGIGLKFVRDGMDSANLVAMYSVDG
ncbi:MAG: hypothetical protein NZ730_11125 [Porticoccaceae bacterium]|nr:hypothetical protein [Porticoccaceae bacterium]